jgi:uncharacterized membrane protein
MNRLLRTLRHLTASRLQASRIFPARSLKTIAASIAASESLHMGELRFVVEAGLDWPELLQGISSRARALQVFSSLRVWDTENNSGVLIYLLLADRKVEIVADRGINQRVHPDTWHDICRNMELQFRKSEFEKGALQGIEMISTLLQQHYPASGAKLNELPDQPVII